MYGEEEALMRKPEEKRPLKDPGVDGTIILKLILKKSDGKD